MRMLVALDTVASVEGSSSNPVMMSYIVLCRRWESTSDGHDFEGMLTRDIIQQACGYPDF
jgi:hypothetical protein